MMNRLSVPELEDEIAKLRAELTSRQRREPEIHWYTCPRCRSFYTSMWGCGCPLFPGERRQTAPLASWPTWSAVTDGAKAVISTGTEADTRRLLDMLYEASDRAKSRPVGA